MHGSADAGVSTGAVTSALAAVSAATSAVTMAAAKSADLVQRNSRNFQCTESDNAAALRQAGGGS